METQQSILKAAQSLFAQLGLKKVTTDDIARKAHVSKTTIYKFFKNKKEIFDLVVQQEAESIIRDIKGAIEPETTVKAKLRAHLIIHISKIRDFVNLYRVTLDTWGEFWEYIARIRVWFLTEEIEIVRQVLAGGVKKGEIYVRDIKLSARILVISLTALEYQWAFKGDDVSLAEYIDTMLEMMVEGIKKR
ncbi:MAG: TetR/AcrR family transcriptional regulator [Candidatus Zixiibacteriota bacterium]